MGSIVADHRKRSKTYFFGLLPPTPNLLPGGAAAKLGGVLRSVAAVVVVLVAPPCLGDNAAFDEASAITSETGAGSTSTTRGDADDDTGTASDTGQSTLRDQDGTSGGDPCLDSGFSYFDPAKLEALGTADVVVDDSNPSAWVADTSSGRIVALTDDEPIEIRPPGEGVLAGIGFHVYVANGAAGIMGIFSFANLTVDFGSTLSGVGDHPLGIFATGDVTIRGVLSVASAMNGPVGAGGNLGGVGGGGDGNGPGGGLAGTDGGSRNRPGGGGGAYGSAGGAGGDGPITPGGSGGSPFGTEALAPLTGGSGGAAAYKNSVGGAGGGGVYVAAGNTLLITGVVDASGAGASAGGAAYAGGGGGGSGGGILLEAPNVEIDGVVGTNGGGGGAEGAGEDGSAIRAPALGGSDGDGGSGSDTDGVAGRGVPTSRRSGTGGGGGAGRIRVNFATSNISVTAFSPSVRSGLATFGTLLCEDGA